MGDLKLEMLKDEVQQKENEREKKWSGNKKI